MAVEAGADAIGVNFFRKSPRYCDPGVARDVVGAIGPRAAVYGLFVDEERPAIARMLDLTRIAGVQLHGDEPEELERGWSVPVLRAVRVDSRERVEAALARRTAGCRVLLDSPLGGGSGATFDASLVAGLSLADVVMAGGLTAENVAERVRDLRPWGIDVASGVEREPGIKDETRVKSFIENARAAR